MSLDRKVRRAKAKRDYRKFGKTWRRERAAQERKLESDGKLPEGVQRLGRKPTFRQYAKISEAMAIQARTPRIPAIPVEQEVSSEWDEEAAEIPTLGDDVPGGDPIEGKAGEVQGKR